MELKKPHLPKKGAGRKLSARLKDLGKQQPPKDIVNKINGGEEKKYITLIGISNGKN